MRFLVLGTFDVVGDDGPLALGSRKQRLILAHLVLRANQMVSTDVLVDAVWEDEPPEAVRSSVQAYISNLRRLVGADRLEGRPPGYVLHVEPGELDAAGFELLVSEGREVLEVDPEEAFEKLSAAIAEWRGPAFADLADEASLLGEIARLTDLRLLATEDRASAGLALGRHAEMVGELQALTIANPLRERLWSLRMLALYRSGRQAEALGAYDEARRELAEQLGIDPSRALQRMHQRILAQDPGLSITPGAPAPPREPGRSDELAAGTRVGVYKIVSVLGRGGMSVVYLAEHEGLKRKVALKLLAPQLATDARFRDRFVRESQLAASLDHPNIIPIYEAGEIDAYLFIAMRYVDGTDLRTLLREDGALDATRTISILWQTAAALDAAHVRGLVHRDVKPGNVLLARVGGGEATEQVYLSDFGLTKRASSLSGITGTGQFVGTLDYAAPEQFQGKPLDARTDVYSLGGVLFECLTGHAPFPRENDAPVMHAHLVEQPPSIAMERPGVGGAIDDVIARAMAKDPGDRFRSAGELAAAAAAALKPAADGAVLRTFLIADIRGYTTFTRERGDEAGAALAAEFARIVREVVEEHQGVLLELRGDEALTVFASARQAIRAAVAIQGACVGAGLERGVGIGLDAGEAVAVEGGYRGNALNLAARLCSEAAAGEVLASDAVTHLASRVEGVAYTEPRTFRLRGFDQPVQAVRVAPASEAMGAAPPAESGLRRLTGGGRRAPAVIAGIVIVALIALGLPRVLDGGEAAAQTFDPGLAVIDQETHELLAQVPLKKPVEGHFADGSFWFLNLEPTSFVEIDAETFEIVKSISAPFPEVGAFAVAEGSIWVTDSEEPVLVEIDVATGREAHRYDYSGEGYTGGLSGPVVGAGSVWIGPQRDVLRIDPGTGEIQATIGTGVPDVPFGTLLIDFPYLNYYGFGDGFLWVPRYDRLLQIDPATDEIVESAIVTPPVKFALGGGGFGWTSSDFSDAVFKVSDASTLGYRVETFETGQGPKSLAYDAGRVWVANFDSGTIGWIDGQTGESGSVRAGHPVTGIAAGAGVVVATIGQGLGIVDRIAALDGNVLHLSVPDVMNSVYDPALATREEMYQVERATCAKLLNYPDAGAPEGWELRPEVAAAMPDVSTDGRTYTFHISDGFAFSPPSNELVNAETFRYSIERALSPDLGDDTLGPAVIDDIEGEAAFRAREADHISGLVTAGDTLTITLEQPSPDFLARLAAPYFCPVPAGTPILEGGVGGAALPSAGPFFASENTPSDALILKRNPNYQGERRGVYDAIAIRMGVDSHAAIARVLDGEAEGVIGFDGALFKGVVLQEPGYRSIYLAGVDHIALNATSPALSDDRTREAIALALNRFDMSPEWFGEWVTDEFLPPYLPGAIQDPGRTLEDPAAAAALMHGRTVNLTIAIPTECHHACPQADGPPAVARKLAGDLEPIGIRLSDAQPVNIEGSVAELADFDVFVAYNEIAYSDTAAYVANEIGEVVPASWFPLDIRREAERMVGLSGDERTKAAVALARRLVDEHIVIPYLNLAIHELLSESVGCRVYPPFGYGVSLTSICPADQTEA